MNPTHTARTALDAYEARARGRRIVGVVDRLADGALAAGGILLANSALPLGFNLPAGSIGMSAGGALVAAGIAWMRRPVRTVRPASATTPISVLATVTAIDARRARHAA